MAVIAAPTILSVATEGLARGGRTSPSSTMLSSAQTIYLRGVMSDLHRVAACHSSLLVSGVRPTVRGVSRYAWPTDAEEIDRIALVATREADGWTGSAQAGSSSSITFAASLNEPDLPLVGRHVYGTAPDAESWAQIKTYDNATKVAALTTVQGTAFAAAATYMIEGERFDMTPAHRSAQSLWKYGHTLQRPDTYILNGRYVDLNHAPDQVYILEYGYYVDLSRLDLTSDTFLRHLREHEEIYIQGIAVKTMIRYDEDRRRSELQIYSGMLEEYANGSCRVSQGTFTDV